MYLGDVGHSVVVGEDRRDHGEAGAVAGVYDEERKAYHRRPEAEGHYSGGDRKDYEKYVDSLREPVGPPGEEEPAAAVHEAAERDDRRDEALGVADGGRLHHLLRERNEAETGGNVEEHEKPCPEEEGVLRELDVLELKLGDAVAKALHLDLRLLEKHRRHDHGNGIVGGERVEDLCDAEASVGDLEVVVEPEEAQGEERFRPAEAKALVDDGRERRA